MKKLLILIGIISITIIGCSKSTTKDVKNNGLDISNMQFGIGALENTDTFDKQKFSYNITISNKEKTEVKKESIEIVLTDWIKQNQIENKITELTFGTGNIIIKGYVNFYTKGLNKYEIVNHKPFMDGVNLVTKEGEKIFLKAQFH
ncbi:hypothetical protein [Gracilibacillus sp. YIM 98692]|uniref:hypothetical protein n=1 Tax=Gracilibacillus sp. YIM 98692 TaxID=2663532 RepID=UPI0013D15306|nr:hypothetical protein [Gracilibacillus sp. YIM 98692]